MNIVTREKAQEVGLKRYYTGRPCRRGHDSERYTSNGMCCTCLYKPAADLVRVVYDIHRGDREAFDLIVREFMAARGIAMRAPMSEDEQGYWKMIDRLRRGGCAEQDIGKFRTYKSFELPKGVNP